MEANIVKETDRTVLYVQGKIAQSSPWNIEQVGEGCNNYLIWVDNDKFVIYNVNADKVLNNGRQYYRIDNYSIVDHCFAAYYFNETVNTKLAQLVFDDGKIFPDNFNWVSECKDNLRIVQLSNKKWILFNTLKKIYTKDKRTASNSRIDFPLLDFNVFIDNNGKKYLTYKCKDKNSCNSYFNYIRYKYDDFILLSEATKQYIVGVKRITTFSHTKLYYRIFHFSERDGHFIGADELYSEYQYIKSINSIKVHSDFGWTIIHFNAQSESFENYLGIGYYPTGEIKISGGYLFIHKQNDNWDIVGPNGVLYSSFWNKVKISFNDIIELDVTNAFNISSHFPITKIQEEYNKCLESMKLNEITETEIIKTEDGKRNESEKNSLRNDLIKENFENNNITPKDMSDFLIHYICKASAIINQKDHILGSDKKPSFDLVIGDGIAWVYNGVLYIVSYKYSKTYRIVNEIKLSPEFYQGLETKFPSGFKKLKTPCSISQIVNVLKDPNSLENLIATNNSLKNGKSAEANGTTEKVIPTNFADKIKKCYSFLLNVSTEENDIKEALYILLKFRK